MNSIKNTIFTALCILLSACKPQLGFENSIQNSKSEILIAELSKYIADKKLTIGWLPTISKDCMKNPEKITQSNCINLVFDVTKENDSYLAVEDLKKEILKIDTNVHTELSGAYVSITAAIRKKNCESAPITPYSFNKCFTELHTQLIKLEDKHVRKS